jgi:hypothetical protein
MIFETDQVEDALWTHKLLWGDQHLNRVVDQLVEEMAELTKELLKYRRHGTRSSVIEARIRGEMADVFQCMEFLGREVAMSREDVTERVNLISIRLRDKLFREVERVKALDLKTPFEGVGH